MTKPTFTTVTLNPDAIIPIDSLAASYHHVFGVIGPYILTHEEWINPAPNELHLVAPDGTRQEFRVVEKTPHPDDPIVIDRARFERMRQYIVTHRAYLNAINFDESVDLLAAHGNADEALQDSDLDPLP